MAPDQEAEPAPPVEFRRSPRKWVMVAGGLMAFGWLLLLASIFVWDVAGIATAILLVMVPVNLWWRHMLRREQARLGLSPERAEGSFIVAFFSPMSAAIAEWRASR
jgi:hypothetical protein